MNVYPNLQLLERTIKAQNGKFKTERVVESLYITCSDPWFEVLLSLDNFFNADPQTGNTSINLRSEVKGAHPYKEIKELLTVSKSRHGIIEKTIFSPRHIKAVYSPQDFLSYSFPERILLYKADSNSVINMGSEEIEIDLIFGEGYSDEIKINGQSLEFLEALFPEGKDIKENLISSHDGEIFLTNPELFPKEIMNLGKPIYISIVNPKPIEIHDQILYLPVTSSWEIGTSADELSGAPELIYNRNLSAEYNSAEDTTKLQLTRDLVPGTDPHAVTKETLDYFCNIVEDVLANK